MNLLELFEDESITDVLVSSTAPVQVVKEGKVQTLNRSFDSAEQVALLAKSLIRDNSGRLDIAKPFAEVNIESSYGNLRIHCILGGQCSTNTHISIRRHPRSFLTLQQLRDSGSISDQDVEKLRAIVSNKQNFVIVGSTGAGKTTLLRAMLSEVINERILTIEDSPELNIEKSVQLFVRESNTDGYGAIDLQALLREALRMRPDRLVVGEARGVELFILLQALNTGHTGAGFTIHANGIVQAKSRMMSLLCFAGANYEMANELIASSIDWVIELDATTRAVKRIDRLAS